MRALIRFAKQPRLRFISHLDLQRFFQRALSRTGLPIAYSQGFNPHPILSFGSALALGWTSEYEIIDFKLAAPMGRKKVEDAMKSALPIDLPVLETKLVDDKHPAPMAMVLASDYIITPAGENVSAVMQAARDLLKEEHVSAIRKTKSGEREIDIRPLIYDMTVTDKAIFARLALTETDTLKPDLLINTLCERAGLDVPETRIHRLALIGHDENKAFKPLMEL